jgi:hypothetical protein
MESNRHSVPLFPEEMGKRERRLLNKEDGRPTAHFNQTFRSPDYFFFGTSATKRMEVVRVSSWKWGRR